VSDPGRLAGVASRGLGLLILLGLAWQVMAQGLRPQGGGFLGFIHGVDLVMALPPRRLVVKAGRVTIEHERRTVERWRAGTGTQNHRG